MRIGIHTGPMVVRAAAPEAALGEAPGIAAFLKNLADAGTVVVGESTFRLVEGWFECEELEAVTMPAAPQPLQLYRVVAEREARSRLQGTGALTPLVAREQELSLLLARWDLAREGRGQVVLVSGEAGVGKSRLVWELRQRVQAGGGQWLEGHGSPFHHDSPLYPVAQWLEQWIAADRSDPPELRLERLREALSRHGLAPEALPLLAALLSLPAGEHPPLPPEAQRHKTLEALLALLLTTAERQPLLLALEDLHWVDPSTLELLGTLAVQAEAVPLLLVLTFRPEFEPPWEQRSSVTRLGLGLLTRSQAGLMIDRLTADRRLDPALREQIVAHTDGVPLFVEEMTKMFLDSTGSGELPRASGEMLKVPGTLEGWLMARLDRLGTAKEVAQLAATIGRELSRELLVAVSPWSEEELDRELDRLVHAELLFRRGLPPRVRYIFKHALLQDAAYNSLLKSDRKRHHERIAEALAGSFPEVAATQPELVAHHFTEAGLPDRALPFWRRAGENAFQASAYLEAAGHLERALALLAELPASVARDEQEIRLQMAFGLAKGAGNHSCLSGSAGCLCASPRAVPARRRPSAALLGPAGAHLPSRAQGKTPSGLGDGEPAPGDGRTRGQPNPAQERLRVDELRPAQSRRPGGRAKPPGGPDRSGQLPDLDSASFHVYRLLEPFLGGIAESAWILWFLGYPGQAVERSREALEKARQISSSFTVGFVKCFSADLHIFRREAGEVLPLARELVDLSAEHRLRPFSIIGDFQLGWVAAEQGDAAAGIETMRRALDARLASGAVAGSTAHFAFLAAHLLEAGRFEEGLAAVERALAISADGGHSLMDAELYRLKGELLLRRGEADDEAESHLHRALEIARRQSARSLELRAAMSLARRWHGLGRSAEARDLLAPIYEWFTEGFETRDLQEARALLAELG